MVVRFKLEQAENRNKIKYSKVVVEKVGLLPKEVWPQTMAMRKELKEKYKDVAITADDYNTVKAADPEGFVEVAPNSDENLPFN